MIRLMDIELPSVSGRLAGGWRPAHWKATYPTGPRRGMPKYKKTAKKSRRKGAEALFRYGNIKNPWNMDVLRSIMSKL